MAQMECAGCDEIGRAGVEAVVLLQRRQGSRQGSTGMRVWCRGFRRRPAQRPDCRNGILTACAWFLH